MSQKVPVDNFQWVDSKEWTAQTIMALDDEAEISYMFEVDLEIPESIHDRYFKIFIFDNLKSYNELDIIRNQQSDM